MRKPRSVRIGSQTYAIQWSAKDLPLISSEQLHGAAVPTRSLIMVDPDREPGHYRDTVLHEVLHAIFATYRLVVPDTEEMEAREEWMIRQLTPVLLDVMQRNPDLFLWLMEGAG